MPNVKKPHFLLLFLLISFGSITAVTYTPALPEMVNFFGVSAKTMSLTMTIFLIGYACGQLLYGPLANRFGRKKALLMGVGLEVFASLLCVFSASLHSFWLLVWARLFMALGASVGLKMSFTLVADTHTEAESRKTIAYLMSAFAITPPLGIAIGGFLVEHFTWVSTFYFMAIYGAVLFLLVLGMRETALTFDRDALKPHKILHKYAATLWQAKLPVAALIVGCGTAFVYVFATLAPFLGIEKMGLSPSDYGLWCLLPSVGIIASSQVSVMLAERFNAYTTIMLGLGIMAVSVALMLFGFSTGAVSPFFLFIPQTIIYVGMGLVFSNASNIATASHDDKASGAAMLSFINMGTATLAVLSLGFIHTSSVLLLPLVYGGLLLVALCGFFVLKKLR